jgi:hypothetical protein
VIKKDYDEIRKPSQKCGGFAYLKKTMIRTNREYIQTWYLLIDTLNDLAINRNNIEKNPQKTSFKVGAINASILIHLAAIVEGAINSLLIKIHVSQKYKNAYREDDFEIIRLYESTLNQIQKSTWKDLSDNLSKTVLGYPLNKKELYAEWETIVYLFEYQNLLAHGGVVIRELKMISNAKSIKELGHVTEKSEESLTKDALFKFLIKKKLIEPIKNDSYIGWQIINSKTVDYFRRHAKFFLAKVYESYLKDNTANSFLESDIKYIEKEL